METPTKTSRSSATATTNAIMSILSSICISPPQQRQQQHIHNPLHHSHGTHSIHKTAPKSLIGKRRLSSGSSSDITSNPPLVVAAATRPRKRYGPRRNSTASLNHIPKKPYYPFDKQLLNERLSSFNILTWTISSDKLTPLTCAIQGWRCHSKRKNELHCQYCNAMIIVRLNERENGSSSGGLELINNFLFESEDEYELEKSYLALRASLIDSYLKRLHNEHYSNCIWKNPNLDIQLVKKQYYLKISDMESILDEFNKNVANLKDNMELILNFKSFNRRKISQFVTRKQLSSLKRYSTNSNGNKDDLMLLLAVFGWELKQQKFGTKNIVLLKCCKCSRRILLGESSQQETSTAVGSKAMTTRNSTTTRKADIPELNSCQYPPELNSQQPIAEVFELILPSSPSDHPHQPASIPVPLSHSNSNSSSLPDLQPASTAAESTRKINWYNKQDEDEDEDIDIIDEHENWCCIVSSETVSLERDDNDVNMPDYGSFESMPGYQVILKVLESNAPPSPIHPVVNEDFNIQGETNSGDESSDLDDDDGGECSRAEYTFDASMALLRSYC